MNEDEVVPQRVPLRVARELTERERALATWIVDHVARLPALHDQLAVARADAICSCGCPSVYLAVPADTPRAELDPAHPDVRHGVDASFTAEGTVGDAPVDVILHLGEGRILELEVWAGSAGGDPRVELPDPATLRVRGQD